MAGAVCCGPFTFPFFWLPDAQQTGFIWLAIVVGNGEGYAAMYGPLVSLFTELFQTRIRCGGASLGHQFASEIAGGLSPTIATVLLSWPERPWPIA